MSCLPDSVRRALLGNAATLVPSEPRPKRRRRWLANCPGLAWVFVTKILDIDLKQLGLLPADQSRLARHPVDIVIFGLAVVLIPYPVGVIADWIADSIDGSKRERVAAFRRRARRFGFFSVPTAWDEMWTRAQSAGKAHVVLKLKDGSFVVGG